VDSIIREEMSIILGGVRVMTSIYTDSLNLFLGRKWSKKLKKQDAKPTFTGF